MRPKISKNLTYKQFTDYYWMKSEMQELCRLFGLNATGSKQDIKMKIEKFYLRGEIPEKKKKKKIESKFDWMNAKLTKSTVITDNYRSSQNVRNFFKSVVGEKFHFSVELLQYMRKSAGKTLEDAVSEYRKIEKRKKSGKLTKISLSCEYNQYIRDFFADNPGKTFKQAVICWNMKKRLPGYRKYSKSDLKFLT